MGKQVALALLIHNNVDMPCSLPSSGPLGSTVLSKPSIIEELLQNKELLEDQAQDSSGSDSEPSEDNLPNIELEPLIKITSSIKYLQAKKRQLSTMEKKSSRLFSNNKRETSFKALSAPRKVVCKSCGESVTFGHVCIEKPKGLNKIESITKSATAIYVNTNGKKVRDQGTQTVRIEELKGLSHYDALRKNKTRISKAFQSSARNYLTDDAESLGRLWRNKQLPTIRKAV
jgi:ribosomal protein L32